MLFNPNDKLTFGKYHGIETGMIYMLAPSYINWMLETTDHCIGELEFLTSLKVIDRFWNQGHVAHNAEIDRKEIERHWLPFVDFEAIKYSGFEFDCITKYATEQNAERLSSRNYKPSREIVKESDREMFLFYPGTGLKSDQTTFLPTSFRYDAAGKTIITFDADNTRWYINILPHQPVVKVSSHYLNEWKFEPDEIKHRIETRTPFVGKLEEGFLSLIK